MHCFGAEIIGILGEIERTISNRLQRLPSLESIISPLTSIFIVFICFIYVVDIIDETDTKFLGKTDYGLSLEDGMVIFGESAAFYPVFALASSNSSLTGIELLSQDKDLVTWKIWYGGGGGITLSAEEE